MATPERIGKYEILSKLGEGATSIVYLGHDPFANRAVAVKAIFPEVLRDRERGKLYRNLLMTEASLAGTGWPSTPRAVARTAPIAPVAPAASTAPMTSQRRADIRG